MTASIDTVTARTMPLRSLMVRGRRYEGPDFQPYVSRGAALLDLRVPGWAEAVDVSTLDLSDALACVVGQLAIKAMLNGPLNGYFEGVDKLFRGARDKQRAACEHGFNVPAVYKRWRARAGDDTWDLHRAFDELTMLWVAEIRHRRAIADSVPAMSAPI